MICISINVKSALSIRDFFVRIDRNDFYNTLGLSLIYNFNDWASLRTFVSYENRNSTDDTVADYNKWDSGAGVTFSARF